MKIGDKVRFLNEIGGGTVVGFQKNNIVLVEDNDGFEIPMLITEVVVANNDNYQKNYNTTKPSPQQGQTTFDNNKSVKALMNEGLDEDTNALHEFDEVDLNKPITFTKPLEERKGGNVVNMYLAFVPHHLQEISTTDFDLYIINDCNYHVFFHLMTVEGNLRRTWKKAEIAPNTKILLDVVKREELNDLEHLSIQVMAYKEEKAFIPKPTFDVALHIELPKLCKLHLFTDNDFFEEKVLLLPFITNDREKKTMDINVEELKEQMQTPNYKEEKKKEEPQKHSGKNEPLVVDLHAEQIIETTAGMQNIDILHYQIDQMKRTMDEHRHHKGKKIIFIHGKGNGVLRNAILSELKRSYRGCTWQDASFREYGYGATVVTIR